MMVRILPVFPPREKASLMSSLSRLVILLSPATTDRGNNRLSFKWLSMKTLVFSLCYFGLGFGAYLVSYLTGFMDQMSLGKTGSIIETGSKLASGAVMAATYTLPFILASGIPSISELALAEDLTCPKYGLSFILGSLLHAIASIFGNISTHSKYNPCYGRQGCNDTSDFLI